MIELVQSVSRWILPVLIVFVPVFAAARGVRVFEAFVEGAGEGFEVAVKILPYMVAMLVAVTLFQDSGAMDMLLRGVAPIFKALGIPSEILPMALVRPLSGSGSLAISASLMEAYGPDSLIGRMASTIQGSTDTTFFIITVYFGSVGVRDARYSLPVGLIADLAGFIAAVWITQAVFGA
ncbi:MAG: spore maturation protein [Firmicutes bacterium]|nr:spore maturation protein [Bacillota bacterium]